MSDELKKKCRVCGGIFPLEQMEKRKKASLGTTNRCKKCASKSHKKWIDEKVKELDSDSNDKRHGTFYGYTIGCRCDRCKEANNEYIKNYRRRKNGSQD